LVVSGGHSHLFYVKSLDSIALVAATRDDAAGEALDKLAKRLHLPYPGGPAIDRLAGRGNPRAVPFSLPRMSSHALDYSFSGLKTAALHFMKQNDLEPDTNPDLENLPQWEYDLIASFQKRVVDHLLQRIRKAALALRPLSLTMAGGVACNRLLRQRLSELGDELGIPTAYPRPSYCTDNAAMVAFLAHLKTRSGEASAPLVDAFPSCRWESLTLTS
jgi:N6-L-threonylcarbamoyladenine synthase